MICANRAEVSGCDGPLADGGGAPGAIGGGGAGGPGGGGGGGAPPADGPEDETFEKESREAAGF